MKAVQDLKVVGKSPQRYDIPAKVDGSLKWAVDVKLPGMVHARNVRPPTAGAKLVSIDESSVRSIPGFLRVVSKGNYVAVVCEREEQAVRAAQTLKCTWEKAGTAPFPSSEDLYKFMRAATPAARPNPAVTGNPDAAFSGAAKTIEAEYDVPFQGHTAFGPAHATADPSNGQMTIYTNDMKSYGMRNGVADFLACLEKACVSCGWKVRRPMAGLRQTTPGSKRPTSQRRSATCSCAVDAQRRDCMGHEGAGVYLQHARRVGRSGNLTAFDYDARAADYGHLGTTK
jgi:CO/xanthine dehydrogenase Mo-binding subunit